MRHGVVPCWSSNRQMLLLLYYCHPLSPLTSAVSARQLLLLHHHHRIAIHSLVSPLSLRGSCCCSTTTTYHRMGASTTLSEPADSINGRKAPSTPHALLLPYPAQGHVTPIMELAKCLAAQGVDITIATIQYVHAKLLRSWQSTSRSHHHLLNIRLRCISDGLPPDFDRETWSSQMQDAIDHNLEEGALELVHTLASEGRPVTCMVGDFFLRWTSSLAERVAVPEFVFWPQNASVFSMYLHLDAIISAGYDPFKNNVRASAGSRDHAAEMNLITCIAGFPKGIHPADLPIESPFGKAGNEWMEENLRHCFDRVGQAEGVIGNSFEALEQDVLQALSLCIQEANKHRSESANYRRWPRSFRTVGPLLVRAALGEPALREQEEVQSVTSFWQEEVQECKEWLDRQPPGSVMYVAFGSIKSITAAQLQEVMLGLAASGHRFLVVVREKAIISAAFDDSTILDPKLWTHVSLEEALPQGFLHSNQHICKVVSWAPQALVLAHPSVAAFFSHCGWNSTLESLYYGVPILGWPWLMDQVTNCWLVSHVWKVGLTLHCNERNETSRADVERGVRQLMEGPIADSLRTKVREIKDWAREAVQGGYGVVSFAEDIIVHSLAPNS